LSRRTTFEDDRHKLARQLAGWAISYPHIAAERERAAAEAQERAEAEREQAEAAALAQARQAERERRQLDQERRQLENDRARLAHLERQMAAAKQAAARARQQQAYDRFWAGICHGLDQMIAKPAQPVVQPAVQVVHSDEPEGSGWLGSPDFNIALLTDPSRW
jgi:hypothetical protein